jgi:hypothetical protein
MALTIWKSWSQVSVTRLAKRVATVRSLKTGTLESID